VKPSATKLFYLPQRPFIVPGNLRDQITYPLCIKGTQEDERLAELLSMVSFVLFGVASSNLKLTVVNPTV